MGGLNVDCISGKLPKITKDPCATQTQGAGRRDCMYDITVLRWGRSWGQCHAGMADIEF